MSKHKLIPYPVIAAAVRGDPEAVNQVLDHYSGYIAALSMRRGYDQNGNPCLAVDEEIRRRIDEAARETGRTGADITLVGASKMNDAAACQEAIAAGIDVLGENRVQEMVAKLAENAYDGAPLHFIRHLQRNKVKQVVGKAALIQSAGSVELLDEIEEQIGRAHV